jgi:hypothetical protein
MVWVRGLQGRIYILISVRQASIIMRTHPLCILKVSVQPIPKIQVMHQVSDYLCCSFRNGIQSCHLIHELHSVAGQVLCTSCGAACILRVANTEANRGRKFYKCQDPGCGFFKYVVSLTSSILHCRAYSSGIMEKRFSLSIQLNPCFACCISFICAVGSARVA